MFTPDAISGPADLDPRVERCRAVVDVLLDVGMKLVRTLDPEQGAPPVSDPVHAYCRLARALRLTLLVEARLTALAEGGAAAVASERGLSQSAEAEDDDEPADELETAEAGETSERLRVERDREAPDEIQRFLTRPLADLAAIICRDLGLAPAEALEVQTAFSDLTANDDDVDERAPRALDPPPTGPWRTPQGSARRAEHRKRPHPPP